MEIAVTIFPVAQLKQIDVVVPAIAGNYTFKSPNIVVVPNSISLTPGEISAIQNFQFDPCLAYDNYNPADMNEEVNQFDAINAMLTPMVGGPPPDVATYEFISKNKGLDAAGLILPLAVWRIEPPFYTNFKTAPCYTP